MKGFFLRCSFAPGVVSNGVPQSLCLGSRFHCCFGFVDAILPLEVRVCVLNAKKRCTAQYSQDADEVICRIWGTPVDNLLCSLGFYRFSYIFLVFFYGFGPPCNLIAITWVRSSTVRAIEVCIVAQYHRHGSRGHIDATLDSHEGCSRVFRTPHRNQ